MNKLCLQPQKQSAILLSEHLTTSDSMLSLEENIIHYMGFSSLLCFASTSKAMHTTPLQLEFKTQYCQLTLYSTYIWDCNLSSGSLAYYGRKIFKHTRYSSGYLTLHNAEYLSASIYLLDLET